MFCNYLHSTELLDAVRLKANTFLRNRKLPFPRIIAALLSGLVGSVQNELNVFAANLENRADLRTEVSAQAFSKARKGFSHRVFSLLNDFLLNLVEQHMPTPRWHGFRLVAGDASKLQLFLQDAVRRKVREAIAFALYLPGAEMTLSFELYSPKVAERQMLFEHLNHLNNSDLLLLDRGYPATWLIAVLVSRGSPFCMRVDDTGFGPVKAFRHSGKTEALVSIAAPSKEQARTYGCPRKPYTVRLLRVVTPNGKVHVLMTSLLDSAAFPAGDFADLYHARWRIEEAFKRLKHRLKLEHLSGVSWLAAQQDFGAKIVCDNLNALAVRAADPSLTNEPLAAHSPHDKANRTYAFAVLKRCLPRWLMNQLPDHDTLNEILAELVKHLVRFVPGASKPRPKRPKPHLCISYKSIA